MGSQQSKGDTIIIDSSYRTNTQQSSSFKSEPWDPRSPSRTIHRTPTMSSNNDIIDPRSPSSQLKRTPLQSKNDKIKQQNTLYSSNNDSPYQPPTCKHKRSKLEEINKENSSN